MSREFEPYKYERTEFTGGGQQWEVKGPGIVHWDSKYHHREEKLAKQQVWALNNAFAMGRMHQQCVVREALGLTTWGSKREVILAERPFSR